MGSWPKDSPKSQEAKIDGVLQQEERDAEALHTLRLWDELVEGRKEVAKQVHRHRQFRERLVERRAELQQLREQSHSKKIESAQCKAHADRLQEFASSLQQQIEDMERSVVALREPNKMLRESLGLTPASADDEESSTLESHLRLIANLRARRDSISLEGCELLRRREVVFEEQKAAEGNRTKLLDEIATEEHNANALRAEHMRLCMERSSLAQALASTAQRSCLGGKLPVLDQQRVSKQHVFSPPPDVPTSVPMSDTRVPEQLAGPWPVSVDPPVVRLPEQPDGPWPDSAESPPVKAPDPSWTSFGPRTGAADCVEWAGRLELFKAQEKLIRSAEDGGVLRALDA